jgi:predicted short-subunit dehydrogenase-like oxidoreductase (DUF2520 family)
MISIVILGTGNVAKHLFDAFMTQNGIEIIQLYGRTQNALSYFNNQVNTTTDLSKIKTADIYLVAISDDAISEVSKFLVGKKGLIVHTSGSIPMSALPHKHRRGVFYPLQTFSANRKVNFKEIPICIEVENEEDNELLNELASAISDNVIQIDNDQRKALHLAAVFANNFTNHMYHTAQEICLQNDVSFELLFPLIKETASKIQDLSPLDAQTGPARRSDTGTLEKHLTQLKNKKHKKIYTLLSESIRKTYGKKL